MKIIYRHRCNRVVRKQILPTASCVALAAMTAVNPAMAQDSVAPAASVGDRAEVGGTGFSEIVVTARRRAEIAQEVPLSITVFDQEGLREKNVVSAIDLAKVTPGLTGSLSSGNASIINFSIRGRGQNFGAAAGSVETYFAEVPLSPNFQRPQLPPQFFDLQSVQVLKGPQGTLFGRSTTGGAVLLQPQLPTDKFEGYGRVQLGNYHNLQVEGAINIPIVADTLNARLSGFYWQRDGYVEHRAQLSDEVQAVFADPVKLAAIFGAGATYDGQNVVQGGKTLVQNNVTIDSKTGLPFQATDLNNQDVLELRGIIDFNPVDSLRNTLLATYHRSNNRNAYNQGNYLLRGAGGVPIGTFQGPSTNPYVSYNSVDPRRRPTEALAVINTTTFDISDALLVKNIFGYIHGKGDNSNGNDVDASPARRIDVYIPFRVSVEDQYTNELQFQGSAMDGRLEFVVGGLLDKIREPLARDELNAASATNSPGTPIDPDRPNAGGILERYLSTNVDSYALFGSFDYKVTDALTLSAGYRHTWDKLKAVQAASQFISLLAPEIPQDADPDLAGFQDTRKLSSSFELDVYNATLNYEINPDMRVYASYRHGEKRGAFNQSAVGPYPIEFGKEKVDSYSAGLKSQFNTGFGRAMFNIEAYFDNYTGYQASYLQLDAGRPGATFALLTITTNIPKVRYKGIDAELNLSINDQVDLNVAYAYVDADIVSFPDPTVTATNGLVDPGLTDNIVPAAPKHNLQVGLDFHGDSTWGKWAIKPSMSYVSDYHFNLFNRTLPAGQAAVFGQFDSVAFGGGVTPGKTLVDMRFELNEIGGSQVGVALGATNLLNNDHIIGAPGTLLFGVEGRTWGPPRMVYGEVFVRF